MLFDLVNNEIENLDNHLINFAAETLKPKITVALEILAKIKNNLIFKNSKIKKSTNVIKNYKIKNLNKKCAKCKIELFIFSGYIVDSNDSPDIFCLNCLEKLSKSKSKEILILYNYSEEELKQFIGRLNFNPKFFNLSKETKIIKVNIN